METEGILLLVVDDQPVNLEVLFQVFEGTHFEVSFVTDGESALELAKTDRPDLILLDVMMPEMDGFEVCRRLKADECMQQIPVIFMSALSDTVDKVKGFELGAVDYITKPINPEEVLARVNAHLTIQQLRKELQGKNTALQETLEREQFLNRELQQACEREKELNQLKSRFISIASHEFRSPLTLIGMTSNMLQRYADRMSDEKKMKYLHIIEESVHEMTDLLNDVLLLSKIEAGSFQFQPKPLDVERFCLNIVERFRVMSEETHTLTFSGTGTQLPSLVDPKLLRHILSNLLTNALKYSPDGGDITVTLERGGENILLRVKDNGLGISEDDRQHLFNAFHRGENVKNIKGTGLGLSIVKQFVELHHGEIWVESALQHGTTFTVKIPL